MSNNYSNAKGTLTCALCKGRESQLPWGKGGACVYKASYDLKKILALFTVAVAVAVAFVLYAKQAGKKRKTKTKAKEKLRQIISAKEYENIYSYIVATGGRGEGRERLWLCGTLLAKFN